VGINYFQTPNIEQFHSIFHIFCILGLAYCSSYLFVSPRHGHVRLQCIFCDRFFHFSLVDLFFLISLLCLHCLAGRFDSVAGSRAEDRQIELKPLVIIFKQGFRVLSG
jgi:hypothetical protein